MHLIPSAWFCYVHIARSGRKAKHLNRSLKPIVAGLSMDFVIFSKNRLQGVADCGVWPLQPIWFKKVSSDAVEMMEND